MIGEWSRKISNQICENQNEKEIIQYGLNQLFWILLNFFAIAISGVLWHEFCFSILVFLEIYFLRPYAGGCWEGKSAPAGRRFWNERSTDEKEKTYDKRCEWDEEKMWLSGTGQDA